MKRRVGGREFYRRAATSVKKIVDGACPQDVPEEQPARIAVRALGTIREPVLAHAPKVIE